MRCKDCYIKVDVCLILKFIAVSPVFAVLVYWLLKLPWSDKDAPAWVQAVGSVAAIFIAIGIAYWQQRQARDVAIRATKERDIGLASRLYRAIFEVRNGVEQLQKQVEENSGIKITGDDPVFYEAMHHRFMTNFDDDLCRKRIRLASEVRFNLGVFIHSLKLSIGSKEGERKDFSTALKIFEGLEERAKILLDEAGKHD